MIRKTVVFLCVSLGFLIFKPLVKAEVPQEYFSDSITVSPEVPSVVNMSNRDINRVTCSKPITDVVFSQEKMVTVKIHQKDAFIKFQVLKKSKETKQAEYVTIPVEFYFVCDGTVYTIIGTPKDIPAVTIHLGSPIKKKLESNIELFSGLPTEQKIIKLIRFVYQDNIPESFTVRKINRTVSPKYRGLELTLYRIVVVEGTGLELNEYTILNTSDKEIELHERDFLYLTEDKGLAITIENLRLSPKEQTRMFIVLRRTENEQ